MGRTAGSAAPAEVHHGSLLLLEQVSQHVPVFPMLPPAGSLLGLPLALQLMVVTPQPSARFSIA